MPCLCSTGFGGTRAQSMGIYFDFAEANEIEARIVNAKLVRVERDVGIVKIRNTNAKERAKRSRV